MFNISAREDPAGRDRAHAVDVEATVGRVDRGPLLGLVRLEVVEGDQATVLGHVLGDDLRGAPGIEVVGPSLAIRSSVSARSGWIRRSSRPARASDRASRTRATDSGKSPKAIGSRSQVVLTLDYGVGALLKSWLVERRGERRRRRGTPPRS